MPYTSISQLELSKDDLPSTFASIDRSWDDEIIYFLMIDRFHDGNNHSVADFQLFSDFEHGKEVLKERCGGTFNGIRLQLEYIKKLGCTCIWLSPVFENYENSYHGYAIRNFLSPDPAFGSLEDLKTLVKEAHTLGLRIVLDIVINHTADTWRYEGEQPEYNGSSFVFGSWRDNEFPIPSELRNVQYYKKHGAVVNWDSYPETQEGDIFELKKLILDESTIGKEVVSTFVSIYSYWIKELDIDGFRLDTVKHIKPLVVANFCEAIREYASYLGKKNFMIFGEVVGGDKLLKKYLKPQKKQHTYSKGIDKVLDFPLHFILEDIIKGKKEVNSLYQLYQRKLKVIKKLNKTWSDFIVFADNHDQIGQLTKTRIAFNSDEKEVIGIIGFLYFLYGIPCLYYGTEQLMQGNGLHDSSIREPMFNKLKKTSFHNIDSKLFKEISHLASLRASMAIFKEANVEFDEISVNGGEFVSCELTKQVVYWSKRIYTEKCILLYNTNKHDSVSLCVKLSTNGLRNKSKFEYVYGGIGTIEIEEKEGCGYLNIDLFSKQFVILK